MQCFSTSGSRPHLGSPSDFRGVARLSANFLKNDIRTEKCWPNSPTYSTDVSVLRGWGGAQITVRHFGSRAKKGAARRETLLYSKEEAEEERKLETRCNTNVGSQQNLASFGVLRFKGFYKFDSNTSPNTHYKLKDH